MIRMNAILKVIFESKAPRPCLGSTTDHECTTAAYLTIFESAKGISSNRSCQVKNLINIRSLILALQRNSLNLSSSVVEFFPRFQD